MKGEWEGVGVQVRLGMGAIDIIACFYDDINDTTKRGNSNLMREKTEEITA